MAECIHGFENELCDSCFPKAVPEKPKVTRAAAAPRRTAGATAKGQRMLVTDDVRIYHVTHVHNLPAIIEAGELRAGMRPTVDLSSELTRELRATAEIVPGVAVAHFVPFALAPDSVPWEELRRGAQEARWSAAARAAASTDFVFLVSTVKALGDGHVITDGDAAATVTRFSSTPQDAAAMLVTLHSDPEKRLGAEALARESFPVDAVQLIGVANDRVRDRVKDLLADSGFEPKVAVYPPWFQLD